MKAKTGFKIVSYVVIVLLVLGIIGFIVYFTNGFTTDFKSFYVVYNDTKYINDTKTIEFPEEKELRFDCKYTFGSVKKDLKGFNVKIIPNITNDTNFDFAIDDKVYSFSGEKDLTSAFDIKTYDDYFTLTLPRYLTMQKVLQNFYNVENVIISSEVNISQKDYLKLIVTSYNGEASISFNFHLSVSVLEIILDKNGIIL